MTTATAGFATFLHALGGAGLAEADKWAQELNLATPRDIVAFDGVEYYVVRYADGREDVDNPDLHLVMVQPFRNNQAELTMLDRRECRVVG